MEWKLKVNRDSADVRAIIDGARHVVKARTGELFTGGTAITASSIGNYDNSSDFHTYHMAKHPNENKWIFWWDQVLLEDGILGDTDSGSSFVIGSFNSDYPDFEADYYALTSGAWAPSTEPLPQLNGVWTNNGTGSWTDAGNWNTFAAPSTSAHTATFSNTISVPTTVVVDTDVTINTITFDHSISYGVGGLGSIHLEATTNPFQLPSISVVKGAHQFLVVTNLKSHTTVEVALDNTLSFNHALNLMSNTLTKMGTGTMSINNLLTTGGGSMDGQEGIVAGVGTVGGDVHNEGGTISPGNSTQISAVPEPSGILLLVWGLSVPLTSRHRKD